MVKFTIDNCIVTDNPSSINLPYIRKYLLQKGDVIFLNDIAMKMYCSEPIHMLKKFQLGDSELQGMVTECIWSKKKWWQFWKKKKFLGCNVEVL